MNGIALDCLNALLIFAECAMVYILALGIWDRPTQKGGHLIHISFAVVCIINALVAQLLDSSIILKIICLCILWTIWLRWMYQISIIKCIFSAVFMLSYIYIIDYIFLLVFTIFVPDVRVQFLSMPIPYYLLCFSSKIFSLLGVAIIYLWSKRHLRTSIDAHTEWLRVLFYPTMSLVLTILLLHIYYTSGMNVGDLLLCVIVLLISDVLVLFIIRHMEIQYLAMQENIFLRNNIKEQTANLSAWMAAYADQRKQSHEFQNHLATISGMLGRDQTDDIKKYISALLTNQYSAALYTDTGRTVVDIVISQKAGQFESKQIELLTSIDNLASFPLPDVDFVIVLANLLDNALEACELIDTSDRRKTILKIRSTHDIRLIYVENTTSSKVIINGSKIVSTKSDAYMHGFGLQNVCNIVTKNNGVYAIAYNETTATFSFTAQFP